MNTSSNVSTRCLYKWPTITALARTGGVERFIQRRMGKPVVFVIGASGNAGAATIAALAERYSDKLEIRAGVRNPDKLKAPAGVTVVHATMGDKENL